MEQRLKDFKKMLEYGKKFEDKFARWLINKGWFVIPKYLYVKEGAPLLLGKLNSYSLPDIDASQEGKRLWFECKRKKRMLYHPAPGYPEENHRCYKKIQEITGDKVFIIFEDETDKQIQYYGNYIDELEKSIYKRNWFFENRKHITFKYPEAFEFINFD